MKIFETKIHEDDLNKINQALLKGELGFGSNVLEFEKKFAMFSRKSQNIAVNSASAAAFIIFAFLKEKYGICDVYTTSLGFTSPAWAARHFNHNIIFVDVNEWLLFDIRDYQKRKKNSSRQKVLMPVLYGGVSNIPGFDEEVTDEIVVVDSAHCVTPTIHSDYLFFSFHPYKPICTSDGGMISTDNTEEAKYFRSYRNFGRYSFGPTYDIGQDGFKFYMNNLNATIGLTQLPKYFEAREVRKKNYKKLSHSYSLLPQDTLSSYYFATTLVENADIQMASLGLSRHYPMLHKTHYFSSNETLPVLENIHSKILNLPIHQLLSKEELETLRNTNE